MWKVCRGFGVRILSGGPGGVDWGEKLSPFKKYKIV